MRQIRQHGREPRPIRDASPPIHLRHDPQSSGSALLHPGAEHRQPIDPTRPAACKVQECRLVGVTRGTQRPRDPRVQVAHSMKHHPFGRCQTPVAGYEHLDRRIVRPVPPARALDSSQCRFASQRSRLTREHCGPSTLLPRQRSGVVHVHPAMRAGQLTTSEQPLDRRLTHAGACQLRTSDHSLLIAQKGSDESDRGVVGRGHRASVIVQRRSARGLAVLCGQLPSTAAPHECGVWLAADACRTPRRCRSLRLKRGQRSICWSAYVFPSGSANCA